LIGALFGLSYGSALANPWVDFSPVVDEYVSGGDDIIGNTVNFGGHQWIVIGAEGKSAVPKDEGIPIENALVLLQKNGDSGGLFDDGNSGNGIAFREKRDTQDLGFSKYHDDAYDTYDGYYADNPEGDNWGDVNEYRGSTLQQAMQDISKSFKKTNEKEWNVIAERTLTANDDSSDKITGDVADQKFWALSYGEWYELSVETDSWSSAWWLRSPDYGCGAFIGLPGGAD
jgi:hypothetical protein